MARTRMLEWDTTLHIRHLAYLLRGGAASFALWFRFAPQAGDIALQVFLEGIEG